MSDNYDNSSDSSHPQPKKTVDESHLNPSQAKNTVVEPNPSKTPRTPLARKDPLEGKTIGDNNRYLLQTLLGQGGMSKVYRALDTKFDDRVVAIKLMTNYSAASGKHLIKRFMAEIKAISRLKHINIIQILDFGVTPALAPFSGSPFYVMEYFAGKTLQNLLTENRTIPLDSLSHIIRQVCAGLKEAHQKGIVHRDLKPDNIFLVAGGAFGEIVKIIDFGIAKNISADDQKSTQLTREGSFIGTYRYASPEQCRGLLNIDQRTDIYSLGVILYEAICGQNPYNLNNDVSSSQANTVPLRKVVGLDKQGKQGSRGRRNYAYPNSLAFQADWIAYHTRVLPKPLKEQPGCENIKDELANIVMKCLAKSPQDRFSDIGELQNA
nr:serine/threonine-protein kinase [Xenococcaceae cyanobacterium MO_188.B32]